MIKKFVLLAALTLAFVMTAPRWSLTTPRMEPVGFCAMTGNDIFATNVNSATVSSKSLDLLYMLSPFNSLWAGTS